MDRLLAMQVFARVVELGSFARAATLLELSRARTSEAVQALENALGTRLLHRTTRRLSLTDDGRHYYERVRRILADVVEAEAEVVRSRGSPRGRLRVDVPVALGRLFLIPALPAFRRRYPELELELRLENRAIDLGREGIDAAITYGEPVDRDLVAKRLATTHLVTCAAPSYLARHGVPELPEGLGKHAAVAFLGPATARPTPWEFLRNGTRVSLEPKAHFAINSMEACVEAAAAGLGVTQVLSSVALSAIEAGRLTPILTHVAADGPSLFVVYAPNHQASARLRAFVAFVIELFSEVDPSWDRILAKAEATPAPSAAKPTGRAKPAPR